MMLGNKQEDYGSKKRGIAILLRLTPIADS